MAASKPRVLYQHQLQKRRKPGKRPSRLPRPDLSLEQILGWIDAFHERTGAWPQVKSGPIPHSPETWQSLDHCLRSGMRAPFGGSSLAKLLFDERGVRNRSNLPPLATEQILEWADAHKEQTGDWPKDTHGPVTSAPGETWMAVDMALRKGQRGMSGGSSLAQLLEEERGKRNCLALPRLYSDHILAWADAFYKREGKWPNCTLGVIPEAPDETWRKVDEHLYHGGRGLPGGSSLARLLAKRRGVRNRASLPELTPGTIVRWAKEHQAKKGEWPIRDSGPVISAPQENWCAIDAALRKGSRGLAGNSSLAKLLDTLLGVRNNQDLPSLNEEMVLKWADAHFHRTGKWPICDSGPVFDSPHETWCGIDTALWRGRRGLVKGLTLARFLEKHRAVRNSGNLTLLNAERILQWADEHHRLTGDWPRARSGPILTAPSERWSAIESALQNGRRGLPGGDTLCRLLEAKRGVPIRTGRDPQPKKPPSTAT